MVQPALIDAHFRKAWMPYFRRDGHPVNSPHAFLDFVGNHLSQEAFLDLPILTGEELHDAAMAKKSASGGLDGWYWKEVKALSLSWFLRLAFCSSPDCKRWSMASGTPRCVRLDSALCVLPVVYRLRASVRLAHKDRFYSWVPDSVFSAGKGLFC